MMADIMLDIESLGTTPGSVVTQVAAVSFDRESGAIGDSVSFNISMQDSLDSGLTVDAGALQFWLLQPQPHTFLTGAKKLNEALGHMSKFLGSRRPVWCHATFDVPLLAAAYKAAKRSFPIHYRDVRDIRTLVDLAGGEIIKPANSTLTKTHDALDDCLYQVGYCVELLKKLKV